MQQQELSSPADGLYRPPDDLLLELSG